MVMSKQHFKPFPLYKQTAFDDFVRGLSAQPVQKADRFFTREVWQFSFLLDFEDGRGWSDSHGRNLFYNVKIYTSEKSEKRKLHVFWVFNTDL